MTDEKPMKMSEIRYILKVGDREHVNVSSETGVYLFSLGERQVAIPKKEATFCNVAGAIRAVHCSNCYEKWLRQNIPSDWLQQGF